MVDEPVENADKEIWRRTPGDYYSPSIHVTAQGGIGIDVGGRVIVMNVEDWFLCGVVGPPESIPLPPLGDSRRPKVPIIGDPQEPPVSASWNAATDKR